MGGKGVKGGRKETTDHRDVVMRSFLLTHLGGHPGKCSN